MDNKPPPSSPPPYDAVSSGLSQASNGEKSAPPYETKQPGDSPNIDNNSTSQELFLQQWLFACSVDPNRPVSLTSSGKPVSPGGPNTPDAALPSAVRFQRHGFQIDLTDPVVNVTNGVDQWHCKVNSVAGEMLALKKPNLLLKNFGYFLVLFERTSPSSDDEILLKEANILLKSLRVDQELCDNGPYRIISISGPRISAVNGDQEDLLIYAEKNLILWSITRNKLSWKVWQGAFYTTCLTPDYVVQLVGNFHLLKRSSGREIGTFQFPRRHESYGIDESARVGPVGSSNGLIMYMPGRKVVYAFSVSDNSVDWHIWKFDEEISGRLLLRMDSIGPELKLLDHQSRVIKAEAKEPVCQKLLLDSLIMRYL